RRHLLRRRVRAAVGPHRGSARASSGFAPALPVRAPRGGRAAGARGPVKVFPAPPIHGRSSSRGSGPANTTEPRHMKIPPSRVIGCGLIVALAGCQQSYPLASRYIKSVPVQASQGALVTVDPSESQELAGA